VSGAPGNGAGADASAGRIAGASGVGSLVRDAACAGVAQVAAASAMTSRLRARLIGFLPVAGTSRGIGPRDGGAHVTRL
jgi:hypothetical protein